MESEAQIRVSLPEAELAALDAWRKRQADQPGRAEALRRLAAMALRAQRAGRETIPLGELNASNDERAANRGPPRKIQPPSFAISASEISKLA